MIRRLRKDIVHTCAESVVHGNLQPFAEPARIVRKMSAADLRSLLQAITETFNGIMRKSSELRKLLVTSTVFALACKDIASYAQFTLHSYTSTWTQLSQSISMPILFL